MADIKYQFAETPEGEPVHISSVSEKCRHIQYICPGCKKAMSFVIPKKHENWKRFFRHKTAGNCHPNSYLHSLAERKIKARFEDRTVPFIVELPAKQICSVKCSLFDKPCESPCYSKVDLHEWYDTCTLEKRVCSADGQEYYVADLLLTHSQHPDREPVLIEICVTHENSEEKRKAGLRIIELVVDRNVENGENDIKRYCEMEVFKKCETIRIEGFKTIIKEDILERIFGIRVKYYKSGRIIFEEYTPCNKFSERTYKTTLLCEFNMIYKDDNFPPDVSCAWNPAKFYIEQLGIKAPRVCMNCAHNSKKGCTKHALPEIVFHDKGKAANICKEYKVSSYHKKHMISQLEGWRIENTYVSQYIKQAPMSDEEYKDAWSKIIEGGKIAKEKYEERMAERMIETQNEMSSEHNAPDYTEPRVVYCDERLLDLEYGFYLTDFNINHSEGTPMTLDEFRVYYCKKRGWKIE